MNEEDNLLINLLSALSNKDDESLDSCLETTNSSSIRDAVNQLQLSQFELLFGKVIKRKQKVWLTAMMSTHYDYFEKSQKLQSQFKQLSIDSSAKMVAECGRKSLEVLGKLEFIVNTQ